MISVEHRYDPNNDESGSNPKGYTSLLYDPATETVYVGPNHAGIVKALTGSDEHNWDDFGYAYGHHKKSPKGSWVRWLDKGVPPEVDKAVHDAFGTSEDRWEFRDRWEFSGAQEPPKIIETTKTEPIHGSGYANRRPFLYHEPTNTVLVGPPDSHHTTMIEDDPDVRAYGERFNDFGTGAFTIYPDYTGKNYVRWWRPNLSKPEHDFVLDAVRDHYNVDATPEYLSDKEWGFTGGILSVKKADSEVDQAKEDRYGLGGSEAPQIKHYDFIPATMYDGDRRPFIYDEQNHAVHIGPLGAYHSKLIDEIARTTGEDVPYRNCGGITHDNARPTSVYQYGGGVPQEVLGHIEDHFGLSEADQWGTFSKIASQLEWKPGTMGKGWVRDDGSIMTWTVDPNSRRPFHMDMHGPMKMEGRKPMYIKDEDGYTVAAGSFEITPDGEIVRNRTDVSLEPFYEHITREDPRLFAPDQRGNEGWGFSA